MRLRSRRINENENDTIPPPPQPQHQIKRLDGQEYFNRLYSDLTQPGAYTRKILKYLRRNQTHSLFKRKRRKFPRRKIVTRYPGNIVQSDLIDMQKFSGSNSGYNFILVVIDCFSKKLWTRSLKTKRGDETATALRSILESMKYPVQTMIFDEGLEYVNQYVSNLLNEFNIHSYHIKSRLKASTAERVNRTIKQALWKIFHETKKTRWVDVISEVVDNYNKTYHTTIKMAPDEVTWENRKQVFKNSFPKFKDKIKCRLAKGDKVRVQLNKDVFDKGYTQNWSDDIFTVEAAFQKNGLCWYRIKDEDGNIYPKYKYFYELNKV